MVVSLLVPLLLSPASVLSKADIAPPVQVWIRPDKNIRQGDRVRVFVRTENDGYLVVFRSDAEGRVRVLFPLDPGMDDFVRGGVDLEIQGRGSRDAFMVEEESGSGVVMAAWSRDPFRFDELVRGDHWDYRVLGPVDDPEGDLLDVVQRVAGGRFEYDTAPYVIGDRYYDYYDRPTVIYSIGIHRPWCVGCYDWDYGWRSGFSFHLSFGSPWWYRPFHFRPYIAFGYDPFFAFGVPYWYRRHFYDPWSHYYNRSYAFGRPVRYYGGRPGIGSGVWYGEAPCAGDPSCRNGRGIADTRHRTGIASTYAQTGYSSEQPRPNAGVTRGITIIGGGPPPRQSPDPRAVRNGIADETGASNGSTRSQMQPPSTTQTYDARPRRDQLEFITRGNTQSTNDPRQNNARTAEPRGDMRSIGDQRGSGYTRPPQTRAGNVRPVPPSETQSSSPRVTPRDPNGGFTTPPRTAVPRSSSVRSAPSSNTRPSTSASPRPSSGPGISNAPRPSSGAGISSVPRSSAAPSAGSARPAARATGTARARGG